MQKQIIFILAILFTAHLSYSAETSQVLNLSQWRAQRLTEANNCLIRVQNKITLVKADTGNLNDISRLESEQRVAEQNIEFAQALTIEDYFNFYLSEYADNDAALVRVAKSLKAKDVANLIKHLLKARVAAASLEGTNDVMTVVTAKNKVESRL